MSQSPDESAASHTDSATGHVDVPHSDSKADHVDTPHNDAKTNHVDTKLAHDDAHWDTAGSKSHTDSAPHDDTSLHTDIGHDDTASHTDVPHQDTPAAHTDIS